MTQKIRSGRLETRSARLRLTLRKRPYSVTIAKGLSLGYRRTATDGPWIVRLTKGGADWATRFAVADDHTEADGVSVLTFWQAQERAKTLAKIGPPNADNTVGRAMQPYAMS